MGAEMEKAGPMPDAVKRRISVPPASESFGTAVATKTSETSSNELEGVKVAYNGSTFTLHHGSVVIAAITSCTNTSNPSVILAAGMLARNAVAKGLTAKPWVETSPAPGPQAATHC